jgi:hypothetical protein
MVKCGRGQVLNLAYTFSRIQSTQKKGGEVPNREPTYCLEKLDGFFTSYYLVPSTVPPPL